MTLMICTCEPFGIEIPSFRRNFSFKLNIDQFSIMGYNKPLALDMGRVSRFYFYIEK